MYTWIDPFCQVSFLHARRIFWSVYQGLPLIVLQSMFSIGAHSQSMSFPKDVQRSTWLICGMPAGFIHPVHSGEKVPKLRAGSDRVGYDDERPQSEMG